MKVGHHIEHEPYYDTVPLDNGDGEYVYIQAGGNGSSTSTSRDNISNAGSTLPMSTKTAYNSQTSTTTDPESPGRGNYVNIDYFLS